MRRILLLLALCGLAHADPLITSPYDWMRIDAQMNQSITNYVKHSGVLSLNPGWQFVQEYTPSACSGTTCVLVSTCATGICIVPPTIGDVVSVALIGNGAVNGSITGISGSTGTTWTNCGTCHSFQSGDSTIDVEYTLNIQNAAQALTITCSPANCANSAYLDIVESRPPSGQTPSLNGGAANVTTSCSPSCTGAAPSITGTDFAIQYVGTPSFLLNNFGAYSSPYVGSLQGAGLCINCPNGTGAPTISTTGATPINAVGISFTTTAGAFTPPTPTFTIKNYTLPTITTGLTCSPGCGAITIPSVTAGNLIFVTEADQAGTGNFTLSTLTGAGTAVIPANCHQNTAAGQEWELNCGYVLSGTGAATTITPTLSGNTTAFFAIWEIHRTSGNFTADTTVGTNGAAGQVNVANATWLPPCPTITLANTNPHVTFQAVAAGGVTSVGTNGATFYPYPFMLGVGDGQSISSNAVGVAISNAILLNDTVGATCVWPFPGLDSNTTKTAVFAASFF